MAFSYSLFLALLLLFPGLCFWAGFRSGEQNDLLTPSPERPHSTITLFMIVLGTLFGHMLGATYFAIQSWWCHATGICLHVGFDPNVYRAMLAGADDARLAPDLAIELWFGSLLAIGVSTGFVAERLSKSETVSGRTDRISFGWLNPAVQAVKQGDSFVVAYVLTKTSYEATTVAYEGLVQHLGLDEDQSITFIVLRDVDRFLVRISDEGVKRIDPVRSEDLKASQISQLQITGLEIANVALEVVRASPSDVLEAAVLTDGQG